MLMFQEFGRAASLAVGLGKWGSVFVLDPGPTRLVMAVAGLLFLWRAFRPATRTRRGEVDPELVALVHDRIARSEQLSCEAVRELTAELVGIRQRLDNRP